MPVYVSVIKTPSEALKGIGNLDTWFEDTKKTMTRMGIKVLGAYALLGRYDMMFIYEAPDEMAAFGMGLAGEAKPGVRSETWTAVPMEEFIQLAGKFK